MTELDAFHNIGSILGSKGGVKADYYSSYSDNRNFIINLFFRDSA